VLITFGIFLGNSWHILSAKQSDRREKRTQV
jgi:hypothetical protein